MVWTHFWDMNSGGGQKLDWAHIYIEAPADEAKAIFFARFGRNPDRVTCTCCGPDYSIDEGEDLGQLTAYHRNCAFEGKAYVERQDEGLRKYVKRGEDESVWLAYLKQNPSSKYCTLDEYMKSDEVTFVPASHIKPEERRAKVPAQGYVWVE